MYVPFGWRSFEVAQSRCMELDAPVMRQRLVDRLAKQSMAEGEQRCLAAGSPQQQTAVDQELDFRLYLADRKTGHKGDRRNSDFVLKDSGERKYPARLNGQAIDAP